MQIGFAVLALLLGMLQSPERQKDPLDLQSFLQSKYQDKTVILRHFYAGQRLSFDSKGQIAKETSEEFWTTCSMVAIKDLKFTDRRLIIEGRRVMYQFDLAAKKFIDIKEDPARVDPKLDMAQQFHAEVALAGGLEWKTALKDAMEKIFLKETENLVDWVPQCWKLYFRRQTPPEQAEINTWFSTIGKDILTRQTPGIISARHISRNHHASFRASYTEEARIAGVNGCVNAVGVVDAQGKPGNLQIIVPMGLGLDESALDQMSKWQYEPAQLNGRPVSFVTDFEICFKPN